MHELSETDRKEKYEFEDILNVPDPDLQQVLMQTKDNLIILALKDAPACLTSKILQNVSSRRREVIKRGIAVLDDINRVNIINARNTLISKVFGIKAKGEEESREITEGVSTRPGVRCGLPSTASSALHKEDSPRKKRPGRVTVDEFKRFLEQHRTRNPGFISVEENKKSILASLWLRRLLEKPPPEKKELNPGPRHGSNRGNTF